MAQLVPVFAAIGAGASLYGTVRQAQISSASAKAQRQTAVAQADARQQMLDAQQAADRRAREARLEGTLAATRARLAAGGVAPDEGSALALTSGLQRDAAAAQSDSDQLFAARMAAGRRSLLNDDGSLTPWLRASGTIGGSLRNLLD
jgi:hypothetical protein